MKFRAKWLHGSALVLLVVGTVLMITSMDPALGQSPADPPPVPKVPGIDQAESPEDVVTSLEVLGLLTILTLTPSIILMMTAFTRIVIVLSFVRRAMATQNLPPNQVLIGLALILTFVVMGPTFKNIHQDALKPYMDQKITGKKAFDKARYHMRKFMFSQTRKKDMALFIKMSEKDPEDVNTRSDISTMILISSFVISELRRAFIMGFAIFLPFVVIDLIVASTLISMGMLVLPPILISLPFKILLFVLVDGWNLVVGSLMQSFLVEM